MSALKTSRPMSFSRRLEGLTGDPTENHVHRAAFSRVRNPCAIVVVGGGPPFLGWSAVLGLRVSLT
jgi:hypothetical protein